MLLERTLCVPTNNRRTNDSSGTHKLDMKWTIWRGNVLGYQSADIIFSENTQFSQSKARRRLWGLRTNFRECFRNTRTRIFSSIRWRTFRHLTRLDQSCASENVWWITHERYWECYKNLRCSIDQSWKFVQWTLLFVLFPLSPLLVLLLTCSFTVLTCFLLHVIVWNFSELKHYIATVRALLDEVRISSDRISI